MDRTKLVFVLAAALAAGAPVPAAAQFGSLFDPPRPPTEVPSRPPARQQPDPYARQQQPQDPYAGQPPVQQATPATPFQPVGPGGRGVQSAPLPPPPGATAAPPPQPAIQQGTFTAPPAGQAPPGQTPPPTGASLQPGDEIVTTLP